MITETDMLTDKGHTKPAHARVLNPLAVVLAHNTGHDHVRNTHSNTSEDRKFATSNLIKEEKSWNTSNELADVDHTAENKGHLVVLAESSKEDGCVVDESVDTRELLEERDGECHSSASDVLGLEKVTSLLELEDDRVLVGAMITF